jgi:hypothetical protein
LAPLASPPLALRVTRRFDEKCTQAREQRACFYFSQENFHFSQETGMIAAVIAARLLEDCYHEGLDRCRAGRRRRVIGIAVISDNGCGSAAANRYAKG